MPIPTFFKDIKKDISKRKKAKQIVDDTINLSTQKRFTMSVLGGSEYDAKQIRLLDEGAVMDAEDYVRAFICRGTIQEYYDNLSDDFVGYITLGHIPLEACPLVLGTWTKEDLRVVDIGDDRKALECVSRMNEDLNIVQDLMKQEVPLSVSVEMYQNLDWDMSDKLQIPVVNKIDIIGFSIVGNPANVNSSDIELQKGVEDMDLKTLKALLNKEPAEDNENLGAEPEEKDKENLDAEGQEEEQKEEMSVLTESEIEELGSIVEENATLREEKEMLESDKAELEQKVAELETKNSELAEKVSELSAKQSEVDDNVEKYVKNIERLFKEQMPKQKETKTKNPVWG